LKIALLIPPLGSLTHPSLGVPSLAAYLRNLGHDVLQCDMGIRALDTMLTPSRLAGYHRTIRAKLEEARRSEPTDEHGKRRLEQLMAADFIAGEVVENIERAKSVLRSGELFYRPDDYVYASNIVRRALDIVSVAHHPTEMSFDDVDYKIKMTFENIYSLARDEERNPFLGILRDDILPRVLPVIPPVAGISVSFIPQLVSGYTLARLLKSASPETHVVMGGGAVISAEERIRRLPEAFEWVDSYIFGEGESAMEKLIEIIESGFARENDLNKLYLKSESRAGRDSMAAAMNLAEREDLGRLPCPDYSGLNIEDYLSPEPVVSVSSTRGCYHGKCAFCGLSLVFKNSFSRRPSEVLFNDIIKIQQEHDARFFFFADDCIPPRTCRDISDFAADLPLPFHWMGEIRFEKQFDRELLEKMSRGGCRLLSFGNESGNQRVLDLMRKKTDVERNKSIIREAARAGIAVHLQNFIGFPGETIDEAGDTVDFLVSMKDSVSSFALATYQLAEYSPVHLDPEAFGVSGIEPRDPDELIPQYSFSTRYGPDARGLRRAYDEAAERLGRAYRLDDDFLDGPVGAHALLFYTRYGETKRENIFPEAPKTPGMAESKPRLKPSVRRLDIPPDTSYLFNPENAKIRRTSGLGTKWLNSADGSLSLKETALRLHRNASGRHPALTVEKAVAAAFFTADSLYRAGFLELD